jgi:cyclopropane fatty-acyl-phospholipid synthase-like methyltransferase
MSQKDLFINSEGDNYYERNKNNLSSPDDMAAKDQIIVSLKTLNIQPKCILEIGCSNGWRLEALRNIYNSDCFGIDPSSNAVDEGTLTFPNISLQ